MVCAAITCEVMENVGTLIEFIDSDGIASPYERFNVDCLTVSPSW
jgi:hypothetical protein